MSDIASRSTATKKATVKVSKPKADLGAADLKTKSVSAEDEAQKAAKARKAKSLSADQRHQLIAEAAYFRAEKRGFAQGWELQDWIEAQIEIDLSS